MDGAIVAIPTSITKSSRDALWRITFIPPNILLAKEPRTHFGVQRSLRLFYGVYSYRYKYLVPVLSSAAVMQ